MPKIRISKKDKEEYNKLMRNAKAKIKRLQKQGIDLMGEIELPNIKAFESRKQFNEWKEFTSKFNKGLKKEYKVRTSPETGIKMLQKEIDKYQEKEKKAIETTEAFYKSTLPESQVIFRKPKKNLDVVEHLPWWKLETRQRLNTRMEMLDRKQSPEKMTERDMIFKNNFIASVEGSFDDNALAIKAVDLLFRMSPKDLLQLFKHERFSDIFSFELYDSEGQQVGANNDQLEAMVTVLTAVKEGGLESVLEENDFLLKNFPDKV